MRGTLAIGSRRLGVSLTLHCGRQRRGEESAGVAGADVVARVTLVAASYRSSRLMESCAMALFEHELILPCSPKAAFDFLRRPANIARISDPNMGLKFTAAPEHIEEGSVLEFQLVSFNQVHKAIHRITRFEPSKLFFEEQEKGPLAMWEHLHQFEPHPEGVRLIDEIDFELPGGLLGLFLSEDKIIDSLEDGFFYRSGQLQHLANAGEIR